MKVILQDTLKKKGISQYKLAKLTGIAASTINKLCNNQTTSIDFNTLQKICITLDCEPSDVLELEKPFTINSHKKDDTN